MYILVCCAHTHTPQGSVCFGMSPVVLCCVARLFSMIKHAELVPCGSSNICKPLPIAAITYAKQCCWPRPPCSHYPLLFRSHPPLLSLSLSLTHTHTKPHTATAQTPLYMLKTGVISCASLGLPSSIICAEQRGTGRDEGQASELKA